MLFSPSSDGDSWDDCMDAGGIAMQALLPRGEIKQFFSLKGTSFNFG